VTILDWRLSILDFRVRINRTLQAFGMDSFVLEAARFPIPRPTAAVGHGENLNRRFCNPINYPIREAAEEILPRAVQVHGPSFRITLHLIGGMIKLGYESICRGEIALGVPLIGSSRLRDGLRMELNAWTSHEPARGFDVVRRTKEQSSPLLYPTHQYGARFLFPNPLPRSHRPSHPGFQVDDPRARRVLQEADAGLLPRFFYDSDSSEEFYISPSLEHKFQIAEAKY
jgi:hypothetical protein